jgi:hypothetical protein
MLARRHPDRADERRRTCSRPRSETERFYAYSVLCRRPRRWTSPRPRRPALVMRQDTFELRQGAGPTRPRSCRSSTTLRFYRLDRWPASVNFDEPTSKPRAERDDGSPAERRCSSSGWRVRARERVTLKLELTQHTGSFAAGAFNKLLPPMFPTSASSRRRAGTSLGVAYAARTLGHRAEIFVPSNSPKVKAYDGRWAPRSRSSRGTMTRRSTRAAREPRRRAGVARVRPARIVAGQGTVGRRGADQVSGRRDRARGDRRRRADRRTRGTRPHARDGVEPETALDDRRARGGGRSTSRTGVRGGLARQAAGEIAFEIVSARRTRRPGFGRPDPRGAAAALA